MTGKQVQKAAFPDNKRPETVKIPLTGNCQGLIVEINLVN
jgi:hypothetical protein